MCYNVNDIYEKEATMTKLSLAKIGLGDFPPCAIEYAQYMKSVLMRSELTVCEYLLDLRTFFRYLIATDRGLDLYEKELEALDFSGVGIERLRLVTTEDLTRYLFYLDTERDNAGAAKLRKIASLRSFFRYLHVKRHLLDQNPATDLEGPKKRPSLPKYLTLEESVLLLQTVESDTASKSRRRDYAIITLFLNCGMRLSELCGINLTDIDKKWESLTVTGKGNKKRQVFLNDSCRAALYPYVKQRLDGDPAKAKQKALFLSRNNQRISNKTVQAMVYKYLDMAGLGGRGLSVHKLRHTAATLMYQQGGTDVRVLQELLGHEQLNTTQIYTHLNSQTVKAAVYNHPLEQIKHKKDEEE